MMKLLRNLLVGITIYFLANEAPASDALLEKCVSTIQDLCKEFKYSIIVVSIPSKDYKIVISPKGIDENSQFFIGSITKQFTAALLIKALSDKNSGDQEETKVDLQKPISEALAGSSFFEDVNNFEKRPDFKEKKSIDWMDNISIHELLTHSSGLDDFYSVENLTQNFGADSAIKPLAINPILAIQSSSFNDTKQYVYSNTNYAICAKIIEHLTCKSYGTYLTDVLKEMGLNDTFAAESGTFKEIKKAQKLKHLILNPMDPLSDNMENAQGTGNIVSTAHDLLEWSQNFHQKQFFTPDFYSLFVETPAFISDGYHYGYGFFIHDETKLGKAFQFRGDVGTYSSDVIYFPDHDIYIVILSADGAGEYNKIVEALSPLF